MNLEQIFGTIISAAFGALGAYIAIRTDLADLKARMTNVEQSTQTSHSRIDKILHKD